MSNQILILTYFFVSMSFNWSKLEV